MSELTTLHQRIAALASEPEVLRKRERLLKGKGTNDALDLILQEIKETCIQRLLVFRNSKSEQLTLHVRAGRVVEVAEPTSETLLEHCPTLVGCQLSEATQCDRQAFGKLVGCFLLDEAQLSVRSATPPGDTASVSIGLALDRPFFEELLSGRPGIGSTGGINLKEYSSRLRKISTAYVRLDGEQVSKSEGSAPYLERLVQLAGEEVSSRAAGSPDGAEREHFILMRTQEESGQAALCAAVGNSVLFVTFPDDQVLQVLGLWSECRV